MQFAFIISREHGSGMDSGSESSVAFDQLSSQQNAHSSGDGSNSNDVHSQWAGSRQDDGSIGPNTNQHLTVVRPGLEGGNSEVEDGFTQNIQSHDFGMEGVPSSLGTVS